MEKYSKIGFFMLFVSFFFQLTGQPFPIGKRDLTLNDPSRNRDIPCTFHYPGVSAGNNVAVAAGQFPVIVFGHGFSMGVGAYENFANELVPLGYIICLPTTEGGLSPNHQTFGLDLKFLNNEIKSKGTNDPNFFLYQKIAGKTAIMGHSMGGGSAFLAAENNTNLTTLVTFAAAETSVSAIAAAANVTVPAIVFIGENDGVTPAADHQIPMFNSLPAGCKGRITIKGGGHCYFANYNLACATGELFTSPQPSITREAQHLAMFNALKPYLAWMLKDEGPQRQVFEQVIGQTATYTSLFNCTMVSVETYDHQVSVYPNPAEDIIFVEISGSEVSEYNIYAVDGRLVLSSVLHHHSDVFSIDISHLSGGVYVLKLKHDQYQTGYRILKR